MSQTSSRHSSSARSPWATGASAFAAAMMLVTGVLQFLQGLVAVIDGDEFFVRSGDYVFRFDATAWGWIHLVIGAVLVAAGLAIFQGNVLGRGVGIALAGFSIVFNFLWLPYYPVWAIVLIALGVLVIWALSVADLSRA